MNSRRSERGLSWLEKPVPRVAFLLLMLASVTATAHAQIQTNLIGYWKFDNNFTDLSPGHRDLTPNGGISFGDGILGQGLVFPNNAGQWAQRPIDDEVYDFGAGDFTITLWVKFTGLADNQIFVEMWAGPSGPGWTFAKHPDNTILFNATPGALVSPIQSLTPGVWYHFVVTRSGNSIEMYRDNVLIASQLGSYVGPITNNANPLLFGLRDLGAFPLDGNLDNVAIWSRALTTQELTDVYAARQMICGCATQPSGFAGGDGSPGNPFQVCSPLHLDNVRNHLSSHFIQTADIDMSGVSFTGPIGVGATPFNGNFNGQHFYISNFSLTTSLGDGTGLFGTVGNSGVLSNINLNNCNVTGIDRVGCLSGIVWGSVNNSKAIGNSNGRDFIGVLSGEIGSGGNVMKSFSYGQSFGNQRVGGLAGQITNGNSFDNYSFAFASAANGGAGGLIGVIMGGNVSNCYSTGVPSGPSYVGGLIGFINGTTSVSNSFWDINSSGVSTSAAGTGKTTAEMHQQATFIGWDFVNTWSIDEGNDYPRLRFPSPPAAPGETDCGNAFDDDCDSFVDCDDSDCASAQPCLVAAGIPTVSAWGLAVMTLLVLCAATIVIRRVPRRIGDPYRVE